MDSALTIKYEDVDVDQLCTTRQDNVEIGTRLCTTKCQHYFHPACLHDWLTLQARANSDAYV